MNLVSPDGVSSVDWTKGSLIAQKQQQPLAWHKVQQDLLLSSKQKHTNSNSGCNLNRPISICLMEMNHWLWT